MADLIWPACVETSLCGEDGVMVGPPAGYPQELWERAVGLVAESLLGCLPLSGLGAFRVCLGKDER